MADGTMERLALLYSDGSFNVLAEGWDISQARAEAIEADTNETNPADFTMLVRVRIALVEHLETPSLKAAPPPPRCWEIIAPVIEAAVDAAEREAAIWREAYHAQYGRAEALALELRRIHHGQPDGHQRPRSPGLVSSGPVTGD